MRKILFTLAVLTALNAQAVEVGQEAPCVSLVNIAADGTESDHCIREPKVEGQAKILEFFSATCSACAKSLPIVSKLAMTLDAKATTRLIGLDRNETLLREYITKHADLINFDVALDINRDATKAYGVNATPTLFVLDANDIVIFKKVGVMSPAEVETVTKLVEGN